MADWFMMAIIHAIVGFEALTLGFIRSGGEEAADAMLIIAFLTYTVAIILIALTYFGDVSGMAIDISTIVLILVAGLFAIIGVGVWGGKGGVDPLRGCLDCTGALMAILAGIFLILKLVGVSAPSVGGGGGGGKKGKKGKKGVGGGRGRSPAKGRGRGRRAGSRSRSRSLSRSRSRSPPGHARGRGHKTGAV